MAAKNTHLRFTALTLLVALLLQPFAAIAQPDKDELRAPPTKTLEQFIDEEFTPEASESLKKQMESLRGKTRTVRIHNFSEAKSHVAEWTKKFKPAKTFMGSMPFVFSVDLQESPQAYEALEALLKKAYEVYEDTGQISEQYVETAALITITKKKVESIPLALSWLTSGQRLKMAVYQRHLDKKLRSAFKRWTKYLSDPRKPIQQIEITKFSGQDPESLSHEILAFKSEGFAIKVQTVPVTKYQTALENLQSNSENQKITRMLVDENQAPKLDFEQSKREAILRMKNTLGLLKGISIASFKEANFQRTPMGKLAELGMAVGVTAMVAVGIHHSLQDQQAAGQAVNMVLPFIVSGLDKMFYTYFQAPFSAFFGQGTSFKFHQIDIRGPNKGYHSFDKNQISFPLLIFLNSFILRWSMLQATTPAIDAIQMTVDFALFWGITSAAVFSAARGFYSKIPLQLQMEKIRARFQENRPTMVLLIMSLWQGIWSVVQLGDLYNWKSTFDLSMVGMGPTEISLRYIMTVLAITGLAWNGYLNFGYFTRLARKISNKLLGKKEHACEVWLKAEFETE